MCQITLSNLCHSCTNICARVREVAARGWKRWIGTDLCEKMCLPKKRVLNLHYLTIKHNTIKHDPFSVAVQLSKTQHLIGFFKQIMWLIRAQEEGKTDPSQWLSAALLTSHLVRKRKLDIVPSPASNELKFRIGNYLPKGMVCILPDHLQ